MVSSITVVIALSVSALLLVSGLVVLGRVRGVRQACQATESEPRTHQEGEDTFTRRGNRAFPSLALLLCSQSRICIFSFFCKFPQDAFSTVKANIKFWWAASILMHYIVLILHVGFFQWDPNKASAFEETVRWGQGNMGH